jgi:nitrite reductase/ring-hydroxylating ferredoxin subunit
MTIDDATLAATAGNATMSDTLRLDLCGVDEVEPGTAIRVETAGLVLAVFNVEGTFYVTDDACTHGPGQLSEGFIEGHVVECNFHQGLFDIRTGAVVAPPCIVPVKTYPASVEAGRIYIDI